MEKIKIGDQEYNVEVADNQEKREQGLMNIKELPKNEGVLFTWKSPQKVGMWMKNTLIPLDIIFINEDQEVISVQKGKPNDETLLQQDNTQYVLEVNQDSGIKEGDNLEFLDDQETVMKVLAPDGSVQMNLQGGERIVSRRETKILIKKAKKAYDSKLDSDYKSLGKYMFKVLKGQDNRNPEYVKSPKSN